MSHDDVDNFIATLDRLKRLAVQGNEQAMDILWMAGVEAGLCLANIEANGSPEMKQALQSLATGRMGWPTVVTYLDGPEEIKRLTRRLRLSECLPYDVKSQVRMTDPMTTLAMEILDHIVDVGSQLRASRRGVGHKRPRLPMYSRTAARLPPLSRSSLPLWWKAASQVFDRCFPDPSSVPWMRALVGNVASSSSVRTTIKKRLHQKLRGLARKN